VDSSAQSQIHAIREANAQLAASVQSQVRPMLDTAQAARRLFNSNIPATWLANTGGVPPDRRLNPKEPSSPRPAPTPPSPLDAAMQVVQNMTDLTDQQELQLQQLLQRRQELVAKQQRVATLQHKLQAVSQPVRFCRHCNHPLYIQLADNSLEPCTRSNRFSCGYDSEGRFVGNPECPKRRNAVKSRRKYAARKAKDLAEKAAPVLYVIDGKARPQ
jgi:hypothetical protein